MAYTTINKSTDYFNTKLYTGNGSVRTETGVGFQPDMVWIKDRTGTNNNEIADAVRGANYQIYPNLTNAQTNAGGHLTAFTSDGFTLGTDGATNTNNSNYVSWNWKAGTTGSGSTTGSGTAKAYSYSVNTTSGFSIINYTGNGTIGQQIPHHLGTTPSLIIQKNRDRTSNFLTYHHKNFSSNGNKLNLNTTDATQTDTGTYNSAPTSTHVVIGNDAGMNTNDESHIMYCFAEKTGYSKFGSYTGNLNVDGPFVYTGFKPAFVLIKNSSNAGLMWNIRDNKRDTFNPNNAVLYPNSNEVENAHGANDVDLLSNGFKIRTNNGHTNASGNTYIFMALGQSLVGSNNVPCTAR